MAFIGLGPAAETFLCSAAAAGTLRLKRELVELEAAWDAPGRKQWGLRRRDAGYGSRESRP